MWDRKFWALSEGEQRKVVLATVAEVETIKDARHAYELSFRIARMLKHGGIENPFDQKRLSYLQQEIKHKYTNAGLCGEESVENAWWARDKYVSAKWAYEQLLRINRFFQKERYERLDRKITYTWDDIPF